MNSTAVPDIVLQLGVGGIFCILVLREVFGFLQRRKGNGSSGDRSVDYWKTEIEAATAKAMAPLSQVMLSQGQRQLDILEDIRDDLGKLRASSHDLRNVMNEHSVRLAVVLERIARKSDQAGV